MRKPIITLRDGTEIFDINIGSEIETGGYCETCWYEREIEYLDIVTGNEEDDYIRIEINCMTINVGSLMRLFGNYYDFITSLDIHQLHDLISSLDSNYYYSASLSDFMSEDEFKDMFKNII